MFEKILVIEYSSSKVAASLNVRRLEYNGQSTDEHIQSWLVENKDVFDSIDKIIIPCRLGNEDAEFMGLYVGLHIRLTKELGDIRFVPLLFISSITKGEILENQITNNKIKSAFLLFTKGSYLVSISNLEERLNESMNFIDELDFMENVIPNLSIENTKDTGHQLANEWGAFRLAKYAGHVMSINKPSSLFFKYKDTQTNNEIVPNPNISIGLLFEPCKALLIDDNADSGWSDVLKFILKQKIVNPVKVVSLNVLKTHEEAEIFNEYEKYDVVFLDLRLRKEEDLPKNIIDVDNYTGTRILKKIKSINRGIQVIIFTASNKVWNIEKLIQIGANGYYIKESPEFIISPKFSNDNYREFVKNIMDCLSLKILRDIDKFHKQWLRFITVDRPGRNIDYQQFYDRTIASLSIAFDLLENSVKDKKYLNFAFLVYFQIIEDYSSLRENFEYFSKRECYVANHTVKVIDDTSGDLIWKLTFKKDSHNGDYFEINDEKKDVEFNVQTLAKISFILGFKFSRSNLDLKDWAKVNNTRNEKAGHAGKNLYVTQSEIKELIQILDLFLTHP